MLHYQRQALSLSLSIAFSKKFSEGTSGPISIHIFAVLNPHESVYISPLNPKKSLKIPILSRTNLEIPIGSELTKASAALARLRVDPRPLRWIFAALGALELVVGQGVEHWGQKKGNHFNWFYCTAIPTHFLSKIGIYHYFGRISLVFTVLILSLWGLL